MLKVTVLVTLTSVWVLRNLGAHVWLLRGEGGLWKAKDATQSPRRGPGMSSRGPWLRTSEHAGLCVCRKGGKVAARGARERRDSAEFLWGGEKRNQVSVPRVLTLPSIPEDEGCQQLAGRSGPDGLNPVKQQNPFFRQNLTQSSPTPPPGLASPHR